MGQVNEIRLYKPAGIAAIFRTELEVEGTGSILLTQKDMPVNNTFNNGLLEKLQYFLIEPIQSDCFKRCIDGRDGTVFFEGKLSDKTINFIIERAS